MHDTYFEYCETYKKKYGENALVLIECGSFFEMYAVDNGNDKAGPEDIYKICDLCNFQLSRKNKSIIENSRSNPLMAGFPSYSLPRHSQTLLAANYTLIIVRQITAPPNPVREVTEIMSPSMNMNPISTETNWLIVIYIDNINNHKLLGLSGLDVTTGKTWIYEVCSTDTDPNIAVDELVRIVSLYVPKEIVVIGNNFGDIKELVDSCKVVHDNTSVDIKIYENIAYQNAQLLKAFDIQSMLSPIEYLGMETRYTVARTSFCYMLQFAFEHNETVVRRLQVPELITMSKKCVIEFNSAVQLQLVSATNDSNEKPLLSILNRCATAFGSRYFKEQLLQPLVSKETLNFRYDCIDYLIKNCSYKQIHINLKKVLDLERMNRRQALGTFNPCDWSGYHTSLCSIVDAISIVKDDTLNIFDGVKELIDELQEGYINSLNIDECSKYNLSEIKGNIFISDNEYDIKIKQLKTSLQNVATKILEENCKIDYNERDGYVLVITKKRWDTVKPSLSTIKIDTEEIKIKDIVAKPISSTSTIVRLCHPYITKISDEIIKNNAILVQQITKQYIEFLRDYSTNYLTKINELVKKVSYIDFITTNAKNAVEFCYYRPILSETDNDKAYVKATDMRHPILEKIRQEVSYVPNDIELSGNGLLLFGVNASGKSSLMKAIGLNIIMAQAGMYVASKRFEIEPYHHIFTRISGNDNIYRGLSTFMVEMMELRNILQRATQYSLVLGDELCSGTESISALAIVTAGIRALERKNVSFVFATHLHDLGKVIENSDKTRFMHMHVEVSPEGYLIFDRKLREGSGSAIYGLEVCRGLGMPSDFLRDAHEIRCKIEGYSTEIVSTKKSKYNPEVFKDICSLCSRAAEEIHHIKEQHTANSLGLIDYEHKNRKSNLVALCSVCHDRLHSNKETLVVKETSRGKKIVKKL